MSIMSEVFSNKLSRVGFSLIPDYDTFVFDVLGHSSYSVDENFPRLTRKNIPLAISKLQYDILLSDIENFKV